MRYTIVLQIIAAVTIGVTLGSFLAHIFGLS